MESRVIDTLGTPELVLSQSWNVLPFPGTEKTRNDDWSLSSDPRQVSLKSQNLRFSGTLTNTLWYSVIYTPYNTDFKNLNSNECAKFQAQPSVSSKVHREEINS
jgi:hypothetical protein